MFAFDSAATAVWCRSGWRDKLDQSMISVIFRILGVFSLGKCTEVQESSGTHGEVKYIRRSLVEMRCTRTDGRSFAIFAQCVIGSFTRLVLGDISAKETVNMVLEERGIYQPSDSA